MTDERCVHEARHGRRAPYFHAMVDERRISLAAIEVCSSSMKSSDEISAPREAACQPTISSLRTPPIGGQSMIWDRGKPMYGARTHWTTIGASMCGSWRAQAF
jgi:hypothetical protein